MQIDICDSHLRSVTGNVDVACELPIGWMRQNDGSWIKGHNLSHRGQGMSWSIGPSDFRKAAEPKDE